MKTETWLADLFERKLLINMGKGGVGRSVLSAAMARAAADAGLRVLVCEVNAKERMSSLLGGRRPESLDSLDQVWQIDDRLWTVNIEPWMAMKEYVVQILRLRLVYNLVFENRVMKYFLRAVPGLQELVFIGKIWFHVAEDKVKDQPRFDLVIVDAPATGHGLAMLRIAQVVLDISPPGPMRTAAQRIQDMLSDDDTTRINLITLPEEMPVNELAELHQRIDDTLQLPFGPVWVNQWPQSACDPALESTLRATWEAGLSDSQGWPLWNMGKLAHANEERARRHLRWLREQVPLATVNVPNIHHAGMRERDWLQQLATRLSSLALQETSPASSLPLQEAPHAD